MTKSRQPPPDDACRVVCFNARKIGRLRRRVPPAAEFAPRAAAHRALAHPGRLAVMELLAIEECCVCDVANVLRIPVSTASQHLKALRSAGLVRSRQEGRLVFHCPARDGLPGPLAEAPRAR